MVVLGKRCPRCGVVKLLSEYYLLDSNKVDGHRYCCKECEREYKRTHKENHRRYYQRHKEEIREYNRRHYLEHREEKLEYGKQYYLANKGEIGKKAKEYREISRPRKRAYYKEYYQSNKERELKRGKNYRDTHQESTKQRIKRYTLGLKVEVLMHYGNGQLVCTRCGYNGDIAALTIDHINGGGRKHRESLDTTKFYSWLRNKNYPVGFATLCQNCQWIKRAENNEYAQVEESKRYKYFKEYRRAYKVDVLTHYGGGKLACVRCGYDDIRALSIDHIGGNGRKHKDKNGIKSNMYVWLKKNGYPVGFQTLCMRCQWVKREENKELEKYFESSEHPDLVREKIREFVDR